MSWIKRPQGGAVGPPASDQPPYNASQSYGGQQNLYPNYQEGNPSNTQQQQYWQMQQQPQYNQQYGQVYQQQEYGTNANQYYNQPTQQQYSQNYTTTQQGFQQNYYQNQGQPIYSQHKLNSDSWEDNWDWGWEDSSKQVRKLQNNAIQTTTPLQASQQQQAFNNANIIEESFATSDSWNWPVDDKRDVSQPAAVALTTTNNQKVENTSNQVAFIENNSESHAPRQNVSSNIPNVQSSEDIKTLNDRDVIKEHLPNLALGKRLHLENLTPQWSIESQMSQESSDGHHTHSEGTYRSENQSRNSNKSSPGLNTDNSNFNYSQSRIDELYPHNVEYAAEEATLVEQDPIQKSTQDNQDELSSTLQELNLSKSENSTYDTSSINKESNTKKIAENVGVLQQHPSISSSNLLSQSSAVAPTQTPSPQMVPSPAPSAGNLPPTPSGSLAMPPPQVSSLLPPPKNLPPAMPSQNPYKLSGPFSHKNISKTTSSNQSVQQYSTVSNTNLTSPAAVNKISQHNRVTVGFGANLETTPDNSERPDQPQVQMFRSLPTVPQNPENLEVAPQNDRNEYLQTAHLSSGNYEENTDFSHNIPPPGLRRMVVGQQETEYSQSMNIAGDEPPPGLSRMVPGQQNEAQGDFNQSNENYMDRHIDGQPMENGGRPYRQAEGQQTSDNYSQSSTRSNERRPIGLDRMVPGESSSNDYSQYQANSYVGSNEERVVTGVDHEYSISSEPGLSDVREQVMDGSEYNEHLIRNPPRSVIGARESSNNTSPDFSSRTDERQREIIMEGENLQDLSIISSGDLTFSREQTVDGADLDVGETPIDRRIEPLEPTDRSVGGGSRRQSLGHVNTSGEDTSERDRLVKSSPRRDVHKSSRDREKEGRYSRGDRKYDRDTERRTGRSERDRRDRDRDRDRERDRDRDRDRRERSPESRRQRRSARPRPHPDDTDYCSDRDRQRYHRRQREGSYTSSSKPPRHEGSRYRDERDQRRYNTIERESSRSHRERDHDRDRDRYDDRYEHKYRDIDPTRKHGNLRKERDEERKRGAAYSPARESRDTATDEDERDRRRRRHHHHRDDYYAGYDVGTLPGGVDPSTVEGADAYTLQYQYYEHLRRTNPAAYLQLYQRLVQPHYAAVPARHPSGVGGYGGVETRGEERSLHSGRSSATGLKHDTDLNTDASLNLHLEESTVRSERMTPFRYSTAHVKASIASGQVVVVPAAYPVDGRPARVTLTPLSHLCVHHAHHHHPGPLIKGITHKKSVIEYCESRVREAAGQPHDPCGYALLWQMLALLLRQNGVVVGTDIAELLMKNAREYEYETPNTGPHHDESRRESSTSGSREDEPQDKQEQITPPEQTDLVAEQDGVEPLDRFRELLLTGNRQEALEWALKRALWGHALVLAAQGGARARAHATARFLASVPPHDPLHSLYCALQARQPPAFTAHTGGGGGGGWWRAHAAMLLANPSARPDHDARCLTLLGDTLAARGLIYCAQFCYVSAGVPFSAHPLAPFQPPSSPPAPVPRLALLLADHKAATFDRFATDEAIFATEIYEYALSLNQDYFIKEFQVYKLVMAVRLADRGRHERALSYCEAAAQAPLHALPPPHLRALAALADRLRYLDGEVADEPPGEEAGAGEGEGVGVSAGAGAGLEASPRRRWLDDIAAAARALHTQPAPPGPAPATQHWTDQVQQYQQSTPSYNESSATDYYQNQEYRQPTETDYEHQSRDHGSQSQNYGQQNQNYTQQSQDYGQQSQDYGQQSQEYGLQSQEYGQQSQDYGLQSQDYGQQSQEYGHEATPDSYGYGDSYWQGSADHYGYGEAGAGMGADAGAGAGADQPRPMITMPGTNATSSPPYEYDDDRPPSVDSNRETDTPKSGAAKASGGAGGAGGGGGGGGGGRRAGWLGGILTRLSLRAPNQMILPDDRNPTIVWDAENKRWRNLDGESEDAAPPPPPPTAPTAPTATTAPQLAGSPQAGVPPPITGAPTSNIFKMQKSRHIKKSYVDVFNPSGSASAPAPGPGSAPGALLPPAPPPAPPAHSLFVPANAHAPHQVIELPPSPTPSPPRPSTPLPDPFQMLLYPGGVGGYEPQVGEESYRSGI